MKRVLFAAVLFFFSLVFVGQIFAQESGGGPEWSKEAFMSQLSSAKDVELAGTIVSHDPLCHCVVVKTTNGEITLQDDYARFMQEYTQAKGLKIGANVKGTYKTVNHINYLTEIEYAM